MRNRAFLSTLTAFVMAAFVVDAAQAATKTWQASGGVMGGSWNDPAHWSGGVPTPGSDDVVFPANSISAGTQYTVTVNLSNAEVQFMDVHSDCNLDLNSNTFKVGTADGQTSNIAAQILLANASENLQFNFSFNGSNRANIIIESYIINAEKPEYLSSLQGAFLPFRNK